MAQGLAWHLRERWRLHKQAFSQTPISPSAYSQNKSRRGFAQKVLVVPKVQHLFQSQIIVAARQEASTPTEPFTTAGMEPRVGRAPNAAPLGAAQADEQRGVSEIALIPGHPARRITIFVLDFGARVQQRLDHTDFHVRPRLFASTNASK